MLDTTTCPHCRRCLLMSPEHFGQEVQCPGCQGQFLAEFPVAESASPRPVGPPVEPGPDEREEAARPADKGLPISRPPHEPPATSRRGLLVLLGLCVCFLGGACLCMLPAWDRSVRVQRFEGEPMPQHAVAPPDVKGDPGPFRPRGPGAPKGAGEFGPLFEELGLAFQDLDGPRLVRQFDAWRVYDELLALQAVPPGLLGERTRALPLLREALALNLEGQARLLAWDGAEVRQVRRLGDDEAVVIVHHRGAPAWA